MKMNLSKKLTLSFLIIIALSVVLAGIGVFASVSINRNYTYLLETPNEKERNLREMKLNFTFMRFRSANFAMETENPEIITQTLTPQLESVYSSFMELLDEYIEYNDLDTAQGQAARQQNRNNAARLRELVEQFKREADSVRAVALTGDASLATTILRNTISLATEINTLLDEMMDSAIDWVNDEAEQMGAVASILTIALVSVAVVCIAVYIALIKFIMGKVYWYENILDNIPFPLSITDMNMKWTFINSAVENLLGKKREEVLGQSCSKWGSAICNTSDCGVECIKRGQESTMFNQSGMDYKANTAYLTDRKNKKTGHIEIVQDITEMMLRQKEEAELVAEIGKISNTFVSAAKQISDGAQSLAQGSTEQAASIEQLSSSVAEIAQKTKTNADMAGKTADLAHSIIVNAEKGSLQMDEMIIAVKDINEASQSIGKIIKTIDDIAFQTNILSLNAAVEAARAGQHGKGFAVVAEEVRNLASKSADAARETGAMIQNSMEKAEFGSRIAGETAASLTEIIAGINESSLLIDEIAKSSEDQTLGIDHINTGIDQVAQVVQQNSATSEESAAASEQMSSQADMLQELISQFKTKGAESSSLNAKRLPSTLPNRTASVHDEVSSQAILSSIFDRF